LKATFTGDSDTATGTKLKTSRFKSITADWTTFANHRYFSH